MSAGGYLTYAERFIELAAQQKHLPQEALLKSFLAGLTQADTDMSEEESEPAHVNTTNPKLPPYDGTQEPGLWLHHVQAAFEACCTPEAQQLRWMVASLRGPAMRYYFYEIKGFVPCQKQAHWPPSSRQDFARTTKRIMFKTS